MRELRKNNFFVSSFCWLMVLGPFSSCSSRKFSQADSCSHASLAFLEKTRDRDKAPQMTLALRREIEGTRKKIQACYEDLYRRTGQTNFHTCLVVGVDVTGNMDYFHFSANEINSDKSFVNCAVRVTRGILWWKYGTDYQLVQTYHFY